MNMSLESVYFDGESGVRQNVALHFADTLVLLGPDGAEIARWPFGDIRREDAPAGRLRLSCASVDHRARLELRDRDLIAQVELACPALDSRTRGSGRGKIAVWSIAAAISLIAIAYIGIPALASRLTAVVPAGMEARFGDIIDDQLHEFLTGIDKNAFSCNEHALHEEAQAVLDDLAQVLAKASGVNEVPRIAVLRMPVANAIALPGGRIYIFTPLLQKLADGDELAGVLSHEMGHVAHRDGMRRFIEQSGFAVLFGFFIGDFGGSAVIVAASQFLTNAAFTRDAERAADEFAAEIMKAQGRKPSALADALERIAPTAERDRVTAYLQSHPLTEERAELLRALDGAEGGEPMIAAQEWSLLQRYCATDKAKSKE